MQRQERVMIISMLMLILFDNVNVWSINEKSDTVKLKVEIDEFVVTGFKQQKELGLNHPSATTISSGILKNKNIMDIKGINGLVPNLFMPDYGSKLTSPVYIRGIGSKINSPSVGLYVDDMPYFEKSSYDFDINETESIEVLRGPQGTLYGRNTMGGVIRVYTKSPFNYKGTNLNASIGSFLTSRFGVSHYGEVNSKLGYSITGNFNHTNGYFINEYSGDKADKMNSASSRIKLEWRPSACLSIKYNSSIDLISQGGYPYAQYNVDKNEYSNVNYDNEGYYKRFILNNGLSTNYFNKHFKLNTQTSLQILSDEQGIDQDFTPEPIYFANQFQKQLMFSEEINIKSNKNKSDLYNWLFGLFGFYQKINNEVHLNMLQNHIRSEKYYIQPTSGFAFYHNSVFRNLLIQGLTITAGIRYDMEWAKINYEGQNVDLINYEIKLKYDPFNSLLDFVELIPKIVLQYEFNSSGIIYASVAKGYKTGGFNTSFETEEQRSFRPEHSWNYEIGARHPFLDKRLSAEFTLFFIDWKNQQISQPLPSGKGQMLTNAGRSQSKGLEFSATYNVYNGIMLNTNYGFTCAKFTEYKKGDLDYAGKHLPFVPSHTLAVGINYNKANPIKYIDRINISLDYNGFGRIYWKEDNIVSQPFYGLLNSKISINKSNCTISLWLKNMLAAQYTAFYFESASSKLAQKGKPFMAGVDFQIKLK
ncbi:MAG: TonB-dependent receptor [Parabacteroides sp.]|nr:TonB-dependent receptor [Parabacteroides sp.]